MRTPMAMWLVALAGCSIDAASFTPSADSGGELADAMDASIDGPDASEAPLELTVSSTMVTVNEAETENVMVGLTAPPDGDMLVTVMSSDTATIDPVGVLLFTEEDWAEQKVKLPAKEDEDIADEELQITIDANEVEAAVVVDVDVVDNDELAIVVSPETMLEVSEGGSAPIAVKLSANPGATVMVAVTSSNPAAATVPPVALQFTPATWDDAQDVPVTGADDVNTVDDDASITFSSSITDDVVVIAQVIDGDVLGIEPSTTNLGTIAEGVGTSMTVELTQQPPGPVTVAVASTDGGAVSVDPPTLDFTTENWNTGKTVQVTALHDLDTADESAEVTLNAPGLAERSVAAAVDDDDTQALVIDPGSLSLDENGTGSLDVHLAFMPAGPLAVSVASVNGAVAAVDDDQLSFTAQNYGVDQSFTVTALDDLDAVDGGTAIRLQSLAAGLSTDVQLSVDDDDTLLIETSTTMVTVGEAGMQSFGVRLTAQPVGSVTVGAMSASTAKATVPSTLLTFNAGNYHTYQYIAVSGVADANLTNESVAITVSSAGLPSVEVNATVTDDDTQTIVVSSSTLTVPEGGTNTVGVSLGYMPAGSVQVAVSSTNTAAATVPPAPLTFLPGNYSVAQPVVVTGVQDADGVNGSATIQLAIGAASASVNVTVTDDDVLTLSSLTLSYAGGALTNPLSPAFTPAQHTYAVDVGLWVQRIQLTVSPSMAGTTVTVAGVAATPGSPSAPVTLNLGVTSIPIVLTNGASTGNYVVNVTRASSVLQQAYAKASNTGAADEYGLSVALYGDTMVVGAHQEDSNSTGINGSQTTNITDEAGAVFVFVRAGTTWTQQAYIKASNTGLGDRFGESVALWGDTLAVGAGFEDSNATGVGGTQLDNSAVDSGAVYVFVRSGTTWSQQAYVKASNTGAGDWFGAQVVLHGDTLAVGARFEDSSAVGVNGSQSSSAASDSGAVYVFVRSGTTWTQQAYVKASNTGAGDGFGEELAIWGDTLAVTAPYEDSAATGIGGIQTSNAVAESGAVYVFVRAGTTWTQQAYVKQSNTGAGDAFGYAVTVWGDTMAATAGLEDSGATGVGGNQTDETVTDSGAVYVFVRSGTTWTQQAYVKASNPGGFDRFGEELSLWGDALAIGAVGEAGSATGIDGVQNDGAPDAGAVYMFLRTGTTWTQQAYVKASNTNGADKFGTAIGLWGDTLVSGATGEDSVATGIGGDQTSNAALESGAAYVLR